MTRWWWLAALLSGCSTQLLDGGPPDAAIPRDLSVETPDLASTFTLHLTWRVELDDKPATCEAAGISTVALRSGDYEKPTVIAAFPCDALDGTAGPFPQGFTKNLSQLNVAGLDAKGNFVAVDALTALFAVGKVKEWVGVQELGQSLLWVDGEPIPQMRQIFQAAATWWAVHGEFPPDTTFIPAQGACCAEVGAICSANPKIWATTTWTDLAFSMPGRFRFGYKFFVTGEMPPAFTVEATADLNCNTVYSDYKIVGTLNGNSFTGIDDVIETDPEE